MKIAVLGAGMVGRAIAADLSASFEVTSFDKNPGSLALLTEKAPLVKTVVFDFSVSTGLGEQLQPFDMVVTAVPGFMGFEVLKQVILAGKNVVDISFSPEDTLQLDELAKEKQVTAIVDCGVAPGMSNLVLGRYNEEMTVDQFACYVGGLPKIRKAPFEYKAPFSPVDVIEEYTRPARLMENGSVVTKAALTETELIDFEGIGTLEAFNTDGLRSVLHTMRHIPNMKEKTLRFPGHAALITALKRSGFFSETPVVYNGTDILPLGFTAALLCREWALQPGEEEFTVMKIIINGTINGNSKTITYSLVDHYDRESQTTSMARSTGYTCAAAVHLLVQRQFAGPGVFPPELIGRYPSCFNFILDYLRERNVIWTKTESA